MQFLRANNQNQQAVSKSVGKAITLPDSTRIEKTAARLTFSGPNGQTVEVTPCPVFDPKLVVNAPKPVHKEGWISKLSFRKTFFGFESWQKRYLILNDRELIYCANPEGQDMPNGKI